MGVGCPTSASSAPRVVGVIVVIVGGVVVGVASCGGTSHGDGGGLGSSV